MTNNKVATAAMPDSNQPKAGDREQQDISDNDVKAATGTGQKSVFVVGYTGEVGKELVKDLVAKGCWSRVVLIGRRQVNFEGELYRNVEVKVVDFEKLDEHADVFKDIDIGFCCLGTTRGKAGASGFYRVDHDYVIQTAELAKAANCQQMHVVSVSSADSRSCFLYNRVKGEVEDHLKGLGFPSLFLYRPAMLLCDREERRVGERCILCCCYPIFKCFPTWISVPTTSVAKAMVNYAVAPGNEKVTAVENADIHLKVEG